MRNFTSILLASITTLGFISTTLAENSHSSFKQKNQINNRGFELINNFPIYLVQSKPLYVCWSLTFSNTGIIHESILRMNGYDGVMVTAYYDTTVNKTIYVQQTMKLRSSSQGILIQGSNPLYAGTTVRHSTYSPDSFLFQITPQGENRAITCDKKGDCSPVEIRACP